ncbi:MAG: tRNA-binding protein [Balneolaceae bacterium]|nr:tRNA-binding protein [Balneolaceae bacterium]
MIEFSDFKKVDLRIGTIRKAYKNEKAHSPAYIMEIDFGELGVKKTSAQIAENYEPGNLAGRQVVAVVNFPPKQIADMMSEVLVLGALSDEKGTVLLEPERKVENGAKVG